jgi:hypothetical protein
MDRRRIELTVRIARRRPGPFTIDRSVDVDVLEDPFMDGSAPPTGGYYWTGSTASRHREFECKLRRHQLRGTPHPAGEQELEARARLQLPTDGDE